MWIKNILHQLIKKANSHCPYELADYKNIHVIHFDLHEEINGYYKYDKRNQYIVINRNLNATMQRVVCAHELGHALLHTRSNTPFMRKHTLYSIDRMEYEANIFAAELLIPDSVGFGYETIQEIAAAYDVPMFLVEIKFKQLLY